MFAMKRVVLLLFGLLQADPRPLPPVTTRNIQFVYVTYVENRAHWSRDIQLKSAELLRNLNTFQWANSWHQLTFTASPSLGYFETSVAKGTVACAWLYQRISAEVTPKLPPLQSGELRAWVLPYATPCFPVAMGREVWLPGANAFAHEITHALGQLDHAWGRRRSGATTRDEDRDDLFDILGKPLYQYPYSKAPTKEKFKWFNATYRLDTITTSKTVTLAPYETVAPGLKAVKVLVPYTEGSISANRIYYLEYRSLSGPSVPLHYDKYVLDIDTLTDVNLWSLQVGKPHSEPGVTFTLLSMTPKGATVSIAIGAER
jgi:hypothetical protein